MNEDAVRNDRMLARERMRRLRASGPTMADLARRAALRDLVAAHRPEFDRLVMRHLGELHGEVNAQRTKP